MTPEVALWLLSALFVGMLFIPLMASFCLMVLVFTAFFHLVVPLAQFMVLMFLSLTVRVAVSGVARFSRG